MFWTPTLIIQGFHICGARQPENMGTEVKALYQTVARQPPTQRQGALIWPNGTWRLQKVGVAISTKWVIFYQMLYLGYEWIRSWFGSKTYPIKRIPRCFRLVVDASTAWPPGKGGCLQTSLQLDNQHWELPQRNGLHCKVAAGINPAVNHQSKLYSVFESESLISYVFQLENTQPAIAFAQHSPLWHPDVSPLSEVGWIACLHTVVQRRFAQASIWYANPASTDSQAPILHFTKVLTTFETTFGGWFW